MTGIEQLTERLRPYKGGEAILCDRPLITRVLIENIDVNNWGLSVTVCPIPTPGLWAPPKPRWGLTTRWDEAHIGEHRWIASYPGWSLYVNPEAVSAVVSAAAEFTTEIDDLLTWADSPQDRYGVLHRRYANLASALNPFR